MKFALIRNNQIVQISNNKFEVHPSLSWIEVSDNCKIDWVYIDGEFVQPTSPSAEELLNVLRYERTKKLKETDWWVLPDRTPTQEQLDYRQALRDITNTYTSLDDVIWPEKPE